MVQLDTPPEKEPVIIGNSRGPPTAATILLVRAENKKREGAKALFMHCSHKNKQVAATAGSGATATDARGERRNAMPVAQSTTPVATAASC